jgi:hypothetical protein
MYSKEEKEEDKRKKEWSQRLTIPYHNPPCNNFKLI